MSYIKDYNAQYDKAERGGYLRETSDTRTVRPESVNAGKPKQAKQPHNYSQYGHGTYRQESPTDIKRPAVELAPEIDRIAMFFALFLDKKEYTAPVFISVAAWVTGWEWLFVVAGVVLIFKIMVIYNLINFVKTALLVQARVVSNDASTSKKMVTTIYEFQTAKGLERASFRSADKRAFDSETESIIYNPANPQHILCVDVLPSLIQDYVYKTKRTVG